MARTSGSRLTKYVSATTIVTAEAANSWYGGLYGSTEGDAYEEKDPVVAGHVHDGLHKDGHAQKVDLVDHVTNQLRNSNLADNAVTPRNIQGFLDQNAAIPESEVIDGNTYYYLDLSGIQNQINNIQTSPFAEDNNVISNSPSNLELDDFVVGSDSLDDDGDPNHDSRLLFDKSKGAFRVGKAEGTQWDDAARGSYSVAFGRNNISSGSSSTVSGGESNELESDAEKSIIGAGNNNKIKSSISCLVGSGQENEIINSEKSFIGAGQENYINSSKASFLGAGGVVAPGTVISPNSIGGSFSSSVSSGVSNSLSTISYSSISSGYNNAISGYLDPATTTSNFIGAGEDNLINTTVGKTPGLETINSSILSGIDNEIKSIDGGSIRNSSIISGESNLLRSSNSSYPVENSIILSGSSNSILNSTNSLIGSAIDSTISVGVYSAILSGVAHSVASTASVICGGGENTGVALGSTIEGGSSNGIVSGISNQINICYSSTIAGGSGNLISDGYSDFIGSGALNSLYGNTDNNYSSIIGGYNNIVKDGYCSLIAGGLQNSIDELISNSVVVGGWQNSLSKKNPSIFTSCFIGAGIGNEIDSNSSNVNSCTITGGLNNSISDSLYSSIVGGEDNGIDTSNYSFVGSGISGSITNPAVAGFIGGGGKDKTNATFGNTISNGKSNAILSGYDNTISSSGIANSILAGYSNTISGISDGSVIVGSSSTVDNSDNIFIVGALNTVAPPAGGVSASSILGGTSNSILANYSAIVSGQNNSNTSDATYSITSGRYAVARSYGERVHSSGRFSSINGSAQDFSLIFRKEIGAADIVFDLKLDGSVENAYLYNGSILYFTAELLMVNTSGLARYGRKRTFIIDNSAGTINVQSGSHTDELDVDLDGSWTIDVIDDGSGQWHIQLGHAAPGTARYAMCICRGSMVKYK